MKREDISRIFEGATKEQIDQLLDLNSADVGRAKGEGKRYQDELSEARAALEKANAAIEELKASAGDAEKLRERIAEYEQAEAERRAAEKQAAEQAEIEERFNAVSGDQKYIHDLVRRGVMADFGAAIKEKANRGKSDREVFDALTRDKGYFASQNPPANMGGIGEVGGDQSAALSDAEYYARLYKN